MNLIIFGGHATPPPSIAGKLGEGARAPASTTDRLCVIWDSGICLPSWMPVPQPVKLKSNKNFRYY